MPGIFGKLHRNFYFTHFLMLEQVIYNGKILTNSVPDVFDCVIFSGPL